MDVTDATELLRSALKVIDDAGVPNALQAPALSGILPLLAGAADASAAVVAAGSSPEQQRGASPHISGGSGSTILDKVAAGLEVEPSKIHYLFTEQDGQPVLKIRASALPKSKSAAAIDIVLLVLAARQLASIEEYTEGDVLRATAKQYGKFDSANFGASMKSIDHLVSTQGCGAGTKRKLTIPGLEAAAEIAAKYLGAV